MEDYILREINRIGELIAALLDKIGLLKKSGAPELIRETAKTELAEQLDLDIDTLLAGEDFIATLVGEYGFSDADLEKFAELLFDFAAASEERGESGGRNRRTLQLPRREEGARIAQPLLHPQGSGQIHQRTSINGTGKTTYIAARKRLPGTQTGRRVHAHHARLVVAPRGDALFGHDGHRHGRRLLGRGGISRPEGRTGIRSGDPDRHHRRRHGQRTG